MSFDELVKYHSLSLMKWDEDFYASENTQLAKAFYEAGQRSKQQKLDELKKSLSKLLNHCKSQEKLPAFYDWDEGYKAAYANVIEDIEEILSEI